MDAPLQGQSRQFVVFRVGNEEYGLPISQVSSIIRYEEPTPVPHAPADVEGVLNLRGRVVPVVDLRKRFGGAGDEEHPEPDRIVVTESDQGAVGLAVDAASEVATIAEEDIQPAPESALGAESADGIEGVANLEGRIVVLLRLERAVPATSFAHARSEEVDAGV